MKIRNTMLLTSVVLRMTSRRMGRLKRRWLMASTMAPTAPTEAASVGVAIPARIEPSTSTISSSGGTSTLRIRTSRARPCTLRASAGRAGARSGRHSAVPMI